MPSAAATSGPAATVAEEMASSDSDVCLSDASCDVPPLPCTTVEHRKVRVSLAVRDLSLLEPGLPFNDTYVHAKCATTMPQRLTCYSIRGLQRHRLLHGDDAKTLAIPVRRQLRLHGFLVSLYSTVMSVPTCNPFVSRN